MDCHFLLQGIFRTQESNLGLLNCRQNLYQLSYEGSPCWTFIFTITLPSLAAQTVKRLPSMQKTRVRSLGPEDPLEKEMATHSSTLAWKIPWMEEPGRLQSMGSQRVRHD